MSRGNPSSSASEEPVSREYNYINASGGSIQYTVCFCFVF